LKGREPLRAAIANLQAGDVLQIQPEGNDTLRGLKVTVARIASEMDAHVGYGETSEGTLLVWTRRGAVRMGAGQQPRSALQDSSRAVAPGGTYAAKELEPTESARYAVAEPMTRQELVDGNKAYFHRLADVAGRGPGAGSLELYADSLLVDPDNVPLDRRPRIAPLPPLK
jgi:hypothetical protein